MSDHTDTPTPTEEPMATKQAAKRKTVKQRGGVTRFPTTQRTLSKATQARMAAMNACEPMVTQQELVAECVRRKIDIARASVGFILNGQWYNDDVARVFCDLTGTKKAKMWPEWLDARGNLRVDE